MVYVWLAIAIGSFIVITFNAITQDFNRWNIYYIFPVIAIIMFFIKKWMMKRFEKHSAFLSEQEKNKK